MIQRIQTVFLLLSMIATVIMFFTPIIIVEDVSLSVTDETFQTLGILAGLIILVSFVTILLYRKRILQIRLCIYNMIFTLAFYGLFFFIISSEIPEQADYAFKIAAIMPIVSFILTYLAFRGIRRDEALIKSLDRLR